MKFSFISLLLLGCLGHGQEEVLSFTPTHVSLVPQAPQWAPAITDEEESEYAKPLPPFSAELQSTPITHTTLDSIEYPPTADAILCNISFKGTLSDGKGFSASCVKAHNYGDSIGLEFNEDTIPSSTQLQLKGTLRYEIRSGTGTETLPAVAIKGRGEYKTAGYIIHYLPDAGEGTKEHVFMVMPPDRTKRSAAAIEDIVFTDKNGKKWSHGNGTLCREEVWYTEDTICFASEEKIETDHGSLQIVLHGKAKAHTASIAQSISLTPTTSPSPAETHTKAVTMQHVKTEFRPQTTDTFCPCFSMTWQQCYSPRHQPIRDEQTERFSFSVLDTVFNGSVTDETGYTIPLRAKEADFTTDGFTVNLVNDKLMPKGFRLHVKGTLDFTAYLQHKSTPSEPVTVPKNGTAQCGVFTIEYVTEWDEKTEYKNFIRVKTDEKNKAQLKHLTKITANCKVDVTSEEQYDTEVLFPLYENDSSLPDSVEVTLWLMKNGQRYTTTIDRVIDLSNNK